MGTLHEGLCTFMTISLLILLRMWNITDKSCRETQNIYFMIKNFFSENCTFNEKVWKDMVEQKRPQITI